MNHQATRHLYISGGNAPRPPANRAIFCDGGVDSTYREGIDLELSHWIPNCTPQRFKASTSTEICMRFVEASIDDTHADFDLVINNHVDVDGVLSTFVLLYPAFALQHRDTLVQAAEIGDFGGWGEVAAQTLFLSLAYLMTELRQQRVEPNEIYRLCYERTHQVLNGQVFPECMPGLEALRTSVARIEDHSIVRSVVTTHLAHYAIPIELAGDIDAALDIPSSNAPFSSSILLPNARAKFDCERAHLVSVESVRGTYYDLWYPGYVWAETVNLWRPTGIQSTGSSNDHVLHDPMLVAAVAELQKREKADGCWTLAHTLSPFATLSGRRFPVVLAFMREDQPAPSAVAPPIVTQILAAAFQL